MRAKGAVHLALGDGGRLSDYRAEGALRALFPRACDRVEAILINTAGGVTGGDRFRLSADVDAGHLVITTQSAERIYRAAHGSTGQVVNQITVASGASASWLPQEVILFEGCALDRELRVDLGPSARFLGVESVIFGRHAMGEALRDIRYDDTITLRRAGRPIYSDRIVIAGDAMARMARAGAGQGAGAMASLFLAAPDAARHLEALRAILPALGAASAPCDDLLVVRLLARDGRALRHTLLPLMSVLAQGPLPRSWSL